MDVTLHSVITCPECGAATEEEMPTDACIFFYECKGCRKMLKPVAGDCCVFCSFGSVECPPMQLERGCCAGMVANSTIEADECAPEETVMRMLEWWELGEDGRFGGTEELQNITLAELKTIFLPNESEDPCMFYQYVVSESQASQLRHTVSHFIDTRRYSYYLAAYQRPTNDG